MAGVQILTGRLDPTPTYAAREWAWVSLGTGEVTIDREVETVLPDGEVRVVTKPAVIPGLGKLSIRLQHRNREYGVQHVGSSAPRRRRRRKGDVPEQYLSVPTLWAGPPRKWECDVYCVQELPAEQPGTRLFALENLLDPEAQVYGPYKVTVTVGGVETCKCKAGLCRLDDCKHRSACVALLEAGVFDDLPPIAATRPVRDESDLPRCFQNLEPSGRWDVAPVA